MTDSDLPIDRGWAWVILVGTSMIQMVTVGCLKAFGLIYAAYLDYFQSSAGSTAWVLSLAVFMLMSCGTLSSSLGKRFGFRSVLFAAAIISCIGYVTSAFVTKLEWLYLTLGIVTGLGVGLTYTPTIVMVTMYFHKRRAFANGITVAGNGVGFFLYPFLITYLLDEYALFGTMIILGGVLLHSCVGAMLMRPLESFKKNHGKELKIMEDSQNVEKIGHSHEIQVLKDGGYDVVESKDSSDNIKNPEEARTMLQNGSTEQQKPKPKSSCLDCVRAFRCRDIFDYRYLCNPVFVVWGLSFSFANMSYSNLFMVIPPHAKMCDVSKSEIAWLVSLAGLADLFGRIIFGWISDLRFVRRRYVYVLGMICGGCSALLAPFARNFATLAVYSCWYGMFGGSYWSLVAPLLADSFGVEKIPVVFGLTTTFISLPSLLSPPLLGMFKDWTGDWDLSFRMAGVWMVLAGIFGLSLPLAEKIQRRREQRHQTSEEEKPVA